MDLNKPFTTIDDNTHDLMQEFKNDLFSDEENENSDEKVNSPIGEKTSKHEETDDSEQEFSSGDTLITNNWFSNSARKQSVLSAMAKNRKSSVITFKRTMSSRNDHRKISLLHQKAADENLNTQIEKINKNDRFKKQLRKFLFGSSKSKRLDSHMSSGTASTYLSYSYSSDSSQRVTQSSETNSNFYEEQQGLISQNQSYSSSIEPSPTISNCEAQSSSLVNNSINNDEKVLSLVYKNESVHSENDARTTSGNYIFHDFIIYYYSLNFK